MLNRPHALYYNGELIAIITNPDPFGNAHQIADQLSPDEGAATVVSIPYNMGNLELWGAFANAITALEIAETIEGPKPPKGCVWVKVDPGDLEAADTDEGGGTTYYGGEITITNDTNVDITLKCSGNDRGDDTVYWPTTEAVLEALFVDGVPGLLDADGGVDYCTNWEDFHDAICQHVNPNDSPFFVFVRDGEVVIKDDCGDELPFDIPPATKG